MERFEIDYDAEAVLLDGSWVRREELAARIRKLLDQGDYRVSRLSLALESLETELARARLVSVRLAPEIAGALEAEALRRGHGASALLRELIQGFLEEAASDEEPGNSLLATGTLDGRWFEG